MTGNNEFKIPERYFENMSSELNLKRVKSEDEFRVPEMYFENLKEQTIRPLRSGKVLRMPSSKIWLGIAGAVVIFISILLIEREEPCESFSCLLEKTELTQEDLEYFEDYEEVSYYYEDY